VVNFTTRPLYPQGKNPRTHWIGDWVYPRASLDDAVKTKFLTLPGLELRPLGRPARCQSLYRLRYPNCWQSYTRIDSVTSQNRVFTFTTVRSLRGSQLNLQRVYVRNSTCLRLRFNSVSTAIVSICGDDTSIAQA
jgi:hypothetical protein